MKSKKLKPAKGQQSQPEISSPTSHPSNYKVVATPNFKNEFKSLLKKYPHLADDFLELTNSLEKNPMAECRARLKKNCYKIDVNFSDKKAGKRGGGRLITCVKVVAKVVYLVSLYDKSDMENIDDLILDQLVAQIPD